MQAAVVRKMQPVPNQQRKLTPAKYEAWKMWQEDGLSIEKVAVSLSSLFLNAYNYSISL